jgi:hypothetical protein
VHIEQHDIGNKLGDQADRRLDVVRLADDLDLIAQLGTDAGPEQAVIIDDHDPGPVTAATGRPGRCGRGHVRLG